MIWYDYVVILTTTDYHVNYVGSVKVAARSGAEAVRKAKKELEISDKDKWINVEEIYKFPRS